MFCPTSRGCWLGSSLARLVGLPSAMPAVCLDLRTSADGERTTTLCRWRTSPRKESDVDEATFRVTPASHGDSYNLSASLNLEANAYYRRFHRGNSLGSASAMSICQRVEECCLDLAMLCPNDSNLNAASYPVVADHVHYPRLA